MLRRIRLVCGAVRSRCLCRPIALPVPVFGFSGFPAGVLTAGFSWLAGGVGFSAVTISSLSAVGALDVCCAGGSVGTNSSGRALCPPKGTFFKTGARHRNKSTHAARLPYRMRRYIIFFLFFLCERAAFMTFAFISSDKTILSIDALYRFIKVIILL